MRALAAFESLRNRTFAQLYAAQTISLFGDALTWVGLVLGLDHREVKRCPRSSHYCRRAERAPFAGARLGHGCAPALC